MEMSVEITEESMGMPSAAAMLERRADVEVGSRGVKRNLEQRDASGSIILPKDQLCENSCVYSRVYAPSDIIADQTKSCYPGIGLHDSSERTLRILCHRVCFIKNYDLVRRTWIRLPVRRDGLSAGSLTSKVFDFFTNNGNSSFI